MTAPRDDGKHACPAPGCARRVPFDLFSCSSHWYLLPSELRRRIWRAWRTGAFGDHAKLRAEAVAWWEQYP